MNDQREILFRGKRIDNGEWVSGGSLIQFLDDGERSVYIPQCAEKCICTHDDVTNNILGFENCVFYKVNPVTVGQYTGLCDTNDIPIYEGDIIRYADELEFRMYEESLECPEEYEDTDFSHMWTTDEVIYGIDVGYPAFDLSNWDGECNGLSSLSESLQYHFEVIGNIHDNPELLKEARV